MFSSSNASIWFFKTTASVSPGLRCGRYPCPSTTSQNHRKAPHAFVFPSQRLGLYPTHSIWMPNDQALKSKFSISVDVAIQLSTGIRNKHIFLILNIYQDFTIRFFFKKFFMCLCVWRGTCTLYVHALEARAQLRMSFPGCHPLCLLDKVSPWSATDQVG